MKDIHFYNSDIKKFFDNHSGFWRLDPCGYVGGGSYAIDILDHDGIVLNTFLYVSSFEYEQDLAGIKQLAQP